MRAKFRFMSVFVILALLLTACSVSITTKINSDGTGEMGFAYKFTKDDLSQLSTYGMKADSLCADMQSQGGTDMPADFGFKQETHGDETWCVGTKKFDSLDALKSEISGSGFNITTMEIKNGKFTFDGTADMSSTDTGGMPFSISISYDLTAPGSIDKGKSNADKYDGNTATWNLGLGQSKNMHLESNTKGGGGGLNLGGGKVGPVRVWVIFVVLCCCLLLVAIIVVVAVYLIKRKPKQPTTLQPTM